MTQHQTLKVTSPAGVELSVHTWGQRPSAAEPREVFVLLHGFPDRALLWEGVARHLAQGGFVIAHDMRGCGQSTPLHGTRHYRYAPLIDDLFAVIDGMKLKQKVHLVGHDWGGLYGWDALFDVRASTRVASFTTMAPSLNQVGQWVRQRLSRPTPARIGQVLHQMFVSNALMGFFAMPVLPTLMWRSGLGVWTFRQMVERLERVRLRVHPGVAGDAVRYLGIYRANLFQQVLRPQPVQRTTIPVHTLIATRDPFLPPRVFEGCADWTLQPSRSEVDATHWAPLSRPEEIARVVANMAATHPQADRLTAEVVS
jgi:pimeloyl-ACP methyl ester carboxylesterase